MTPTPAVEPSVNAAERELLSRARGGDRQAQTDLYERYIYGSTAIRGMLRRAMATEAEREDLLHEIFLAVIGSTGEFRGDARLSTYLFRIAQLTVLEAHRAASTQKRGGRLRLIGDAEWSENPAHEPRASAFEFQEVETRVVLDRLMERVPEAYREALRMRIVEDLDYQQIADRLGIPVNTVATRIFKGKAVLAELLKKGGFRVG